MNAERAAQRGELLLFAAMLLLLAAVRFALNSGPGPFGVDGSYYAQIARNVAEGRGFTTSVDLYHQGLDPMPAPTNAYPLWPLLLGGVGRIVGLREAMRDLPRILYLVALIPFYFAARRVAPDAQRIAGPLTVAHVAVLMFALTPIFFSSTTYPYTEALAFALAGAALLTAFRSGAWWGLLCGALAGLATLTRSQMLLLTFGILAARAFAAVRDRLWKDFVLTAAGATAMIVPWLWYVSRFSGVFALSNLSASYRQTPAIPPYDFGIPSSSTGAAVLLRLQGLLTAFNPMSNDSFVALFGAAALLVPLAALHWCRRALRRETRISAGVLAIALSGAFLSFILALLPARFFRMWLFGWRHGLPFMFLIVLALVELIGFGSRAIRIATMAVAAVSILLAGLIVVRTVVAGPPPGPTLAERQLSAWLETQPPSTVVLTTNAQSLAPYSHANFRWTVCGDSAQSVRAMLTLVRTDYVAVYEQEQGCSFAKGIDDLVQPVTLFGAKPRRILLLRTRR